MSTGRWLWVCLQRYVMTGALGWVAAALILPVLGDDPFWASFGAGLGVGLIGVPLLTTVTMFVRPAGRSAVRAADRRSLADPGRLADRAASGPAAARGPARATAVSDRARRAVRVPGVGAALPGRPRHGGGAALTRRPGRPCGAAGPDGAGGRGTADRVVVEALVQTSADAEPEVAEAGLETLCTIWRRDGVVGEDLLLKLDPRAQGRVRALRRQGAEPLVRTAAIGFDAP